MRENGGGAIIVDGVDVRAAAAGRVLCDGFDTVPAGASADYIPALATVVERVRPDVLFVQSSHEIETVARVG